MPNQKNADKLLDYGVVAAKQMNHIAQTWRIPFMQHISTLTLQVLNAVKGTTANRHLCLRIVELINQLNHAIVGVSVATRAMISIDILNIMGDFAQTLEKIHSYLISQQQLGRIRRLLKQSEITAQLERCEVGLQTVVDAFKLKCGSVVAVAAFETVEVDAERRQQEIMALLKNEDCSSEYSSSLSGISVYGGSSASLLSLLPAYPKVFHGRESELQHIVSALLQSARIAILGTGGIGKTTLATAALHHPDIIKKYPHRHFISCESITTNGQLINTTAFHIGIQKSRPSSRAILKELGKPGRAPTLLLLDNLETVWEEKESRGSVEEFLSLLTDIPKCDLMITMRGAERPGKVKWTRPFLPPLDPISLAASRETFIDIAGPPTSEEESDLAELLELTRDLPLACSLMANVASSEGYSTTLSRWKVENTALLSSGHDRRSNLDKSIAVSLNSPRVASMPAAKDLLSLLSVLPDGISDSDLQKSTVITASILPRCKTLLLRTSFAHLTLDGRLKALSPIRDYFRIHHPPPQAVVAPLRTHWQNILAMWMNYQALLDDIVPLLRSNAGNIENMLLYKLTNDGLNSLDVDYVNAMLNFVAFSTLERAGDGASLLTSHLAQCVESLGDMQIQMRYNRYRLKPDVVPYARAAEADILIEQAIQYHTSESDEAGLVKTYAQGAAYYSRHGQVQKALGLVRHATSLILTREALGGPPIILPIAFDIRAGIETMLGNYQEAHWYSRMGQHLARLAGSTNDTLACLMHEIRIFATLGYLSRALELCNAGRDLLTQTNSKNTERELSLLDVEGDIAILKSEYLRAQEIFQKILSICKPTDFYHIYASQNILQINMVLGTEESNMSERLAATKKASISLDWTPGLLFSQRLESQLQLLRGETSQARASYLLCFESYRKIYSNSGMCFCLEILADYANRMFSMEETFHWATIYFARARKAKDLAETYKALRCLGDIFLEWDDTDTALAVVQAVLEGATEMDVHRLRAECMSRMGDIFLRRKNAKEADSMWLRAQELFARSSLQKEATEIGRRRAQLEVKMPDGSYQ